HGVAATISAATWTAVSGPVAGITGTAAMSVAHGMSGGEYDVPPTSTLATNSSLIVSANGSPHCSLKPYLPRGSVPRGITGASMIVSVMPGSAFSVALASIGIEASPWVRRSAPMDEQKCEPKKLVQEKASPPICAPAGTCAMKRTSPTPGTFGKSIVGVTGP